MLVTLYSRPTLSRPAGLLSALLLLFAVLLGSSSLLLAQETKPAPATPIDSKKAELGGKTWDPAWDELIEKDIPPEMLTSQVPHDVRKFCPRFYTMSEVDKRAFWAYFFQALAGAEAGLNPKTRVRHTEPEVAKVDPVTGKMVRSEGLLQLSYEDQKRYSCDFDWDRDKELPANDPSKTILQPKNNLECGIKILSNQIITQKKPLLSKTGYWSTLQPGRKSYRVFAKEMINPPEACGLPRPAKISPAITTVAVKNQADATKASKIDAKSLQADAAKTESAKAQP
jgi:hypothetical protein